MAILGTNCPYGNPDCKWCNSKQALSGFAPYTPITVSPKTEPTSATYIANRLIDAETIGSALMEVRKHQPGDDIREMLQQGIAVSDRHIRPAAHDIMAMLEERHRWFNSLPKPHLTWAEYQRCLSMDAYEVQVFLAGKRFRQAGIPHTSSMFEWPAASLGRKD